MSVGYAKVILARPYAYEKIDILQAYQCLVNTGDIWRMKKYHTEWAAAAIAAGQLKEMSN